MLHVRPLIRIHVNFLCWFSKLQLRVSRHTRDAIKEQCIFEVPFLLASHVTIHAKCDVKTVESQPNPVRVVLYSSLVNKLSGSSRGC